MLAGIGFLIHASIISGEALFGPFICGHCFSMDWVNCLILVWLGLRSGLGVNCGWFLSFEVLVGDGLCMGLLRLICCSRD